MKVNPKRTVFVGQITDSAIKLIKCCRNKNSGHIIAVHVQEMAAGADEQKIAGELSSALKKLGYKDNHLILSLAHRYATSRYLKIPSQSSREIEGIIALQAPRYLPYSPDELVTGFQILSTDKEGYSWINLIIVHKDIIERYLKILKEAKISQANIILSSYGLVNLFNFIQVSSAGAVMLVDIDGEELELAIVKEKKLTFSRSFRVNKLQDAWEGILIDQIDKTQDAYLRDTVNDPIRKIIIFGPEKLTYDFAQILSKKQTLPVETLQYAQRLEVSPELSTMLSQGQQHSFASLIGLGLHSEVETLNLLPTPAKEKKRQISQTRELVRLVLFFCGIILVLVLATLRNLDNKASYLQQLNAQLEKISKEAKPLEVIQERLKMVQDRGAKSSSILNIIHELNQIAPDEISLVSLNYEEDSQLILRGQTRRLNAVFSFAERLQNSAAFKSFSVKVKYATQKNTRLGELVDFEIVCLKK